jgi:hypothetical protein
MSVTRHQIFKIAISRDSNLELDKIATDKIDNFLSEPNNIYVNHSVCILTESVERYGSMENVNRFILISLVYEDLNETALDLSDTSPVIKQVVRREIKTASKIPKPDIETAFDRITSNLQSKENNQIIIKDEKEGDLRST